MSRRKHVSLLLLGALGAALVSADCARAPGAGGGPARAPGPPAGRAVDERELGRLGLLATGDLPADEELRATRERLARGELTLEQHVDELLARAPFADVVGPAVVLQGWALETYATVENQFFGDYVLKHSASTPRVHYLRTPCAAAAAERVRPWWSPSEELLVCPEAHQPDHFKEPKTGWSCDGTLVGEALARHPYCGCGPSLMRCYPSEEALYDGARSATREVVDTAGWIIREDLPLARVFTENRTVRDRNAELRYRRWRVEDGEPAAVLDLPSLASWPAARDPSPRHEFV
ncbi:MAG TPA: hypothetical protein VFS00_21680, partial [Polyangiaceae bacterium]|nr:hypothetical protein [Polyangiaceae bacterium]